MRGGADNASEISGIESSGNVLVDCNAVGGDARPAERFQNFSVAVTVQATYATVLT